MSKVIVETTGKPSKSEALSTTTAIAGIDFLKALVGDFKDIIVELIRASQANPLIGIVVAIITVNILRKIRFIDVETEHILYAIVGTAAGIDILKELFSIADIFGTNKSTDLVKPVPTTLTHAQSEAKGGEDSAVKQAQGAATLATVMKLVAAAA